MLAAALVLGACGGSTRGLVGEELYEQSCASCHGSAGEGASGPALGPGSNSESLTDEQIAGSITVGPGAMPGFSRLSDAQVDSLVAYVRVLQTGG